VLPLRKGGFYIVHGPKLVCVPLDLQRFDVFLNSSAGTSVCYTTFPGFRSAHRCKTSGIVIKSKSAV
jgi:hypothetical protein